MSIYWNLGSQYYHVSMEIQCSKYPPAIGHFPDILALCPDKTAFYWTNCLISYQNDVQ